MYHVLHNFWKFPSLEIVLKSFFDLGKIIAITKAFNYIAFSFIQAYKNLVASTGEEQQKLPGLPYTPDQLFFIGTAQVIQ